MPEGRRLVGRKQRPGPAVRPGSVRCQRRSVASGLLGREGAREALPCVPSPGRVKPLETARECSVMTLMFKSPGWPSGAGRGPWPWRPFCLSCVCAFIGALSGGAQLQQQRSFVRRSVRNAERAELRLIDNTLAVKARRHQTVVSSMEKGWDEWLGEWASCKRDPRLYKTG